MKRIPITFEVEGQTYEIVRTRALECEYEKITKQSSLSEQDERAFADYIKLQAETEELAEKFRTAKEDFYNDVLNEEKEKKFLAFEKLYNRKYQEIVDFTATHKDFSTQKVEEIAMDNGVKLFVLALSQKYEMSQDQAKSVWEKFRDFLSEKYGMQSPREWILTMVRELFEGEEEEADPFLKQARAKAQQRMEQRKGLSKIKK